ncbi:hypothetical protein GGF41_008572 [Coemansia sp. RSA 2531]|nr:hypothetical protein GGF41_008572 [Coemansia sp. RSA 2531]
MLALARVVRLLVSRRCDGSNSASTGLDSFWQSYASCRAVRHIGSLCRIVVVVLAINGVIQPSVPAIVGYICVLLGCRISCSAWADRIATMIIVTGLGMRVWSGGGGWRCFLYSALWSR